MSTVDGVEIAQLVRRTIDEESSAIAQARGDADRSVRWDDARAHFTGTAHERMP